MTESIDTRLERAYLHMLSAVPHMGVASDTRGFINRPPKFALELEGYETTEGVVPGLVSNPEARRHPLYARCMAGALALVLPHRYMNRNAEATKLVNTYYLQDPAGGMAIHMTAAAVREFLLRHILDLCDVINPDGRWPTVDVTKVREPWQEGVFYDIMLVYHQVHFVERDPSYVAAMYKFVTAVLRKTPLRASPYLSGVVLRDFALRHVDTLLDRRSLPLVDMDDLRDLARGLYASGALAPSFSRRGPRAEREFCDHVAHCRMIDPAHPGVIPDGAPKVKPFTPSELPNWKASTAPYRTPKE